MKDIQPMTTVTDMEYIEEVPVGNQTMYRFRVETSNGHNGFALAKSRSPWYTVGTLVSIWQNGRKLSISPPATNHKPPAPTPGTGSTDTVGLSMAKWALAVDPNPHNASMLIDAAYKLAAKKTPKP
jgi:hypothetical protein